MRWCLSDPELCAGSGFAPAPDAPGPFQKCPRAPPNCHGPAPNEPTPSHNVPKPSPQIVPDSSKPGPSADGRREKHPECLRVLDTVCSCPTLSSALSAECNTFPTTTEKIAKYQTLSLNDPQTDGRTENQPRDEVLEALQISPCSDLR